MRFLDAHGFAGGFSLGTVQAGWELVGKRESSAMGGFGIRQMEANRRLLGDNWESQSSLPADWTPVDAELLICCPPCSGFSVLSNAKFRGVDSSINQCMWDVVELAVKVRPQTFILESVGSAFKQGISLMRALRARLEEGTGQRYFMTHVLQDNYSLGGCSKRQRYFMVCSVDPFGAEPPALTRLPTLADAIGDLETLTETEISRPYTTAPTWWSRRLRSPHGVVDGHWTPMGDALHRELDLLRDRVTWGEGEDTATVARRYFETIGQLPESWQQSTRQDGKTRAEWATGLDFKLGMFQNVRWNWDKPARVVTGAGPHVGIHPHLPRFFTHREIARIMGFPDDWVTYPLRDFRPLATGWGKGVSVHAGRWIAHWARESMLGNPGQYDQVRVSDVLGALSPADEDREHVIDVRHWWKTGREVT